MAYKIAIASSDEIHIDETFGSAKLFHIYEIQDGKYQKVEERFVKENIEEKKQENIKEKIEGRIEEKIDKEIHEKIKESNCGVSDGCNKDGCHSGVGGGCASNEEYSQKIELIADCRCVICKKIGFHIQKQLERKAITSFDVNCTIEQALEKISFYYDKKDKGQSLRGIRSE